MRGRQVSSWVSQVYRCPYASTVQTRQKRTEPRTDTLGDLELGIERPRRERILLSLLQV